MLDRQSELEAFKREIDLTEYAAACGYELDRAASSRCSAVLVHGSGDKIVVAKDPDGHWIFFSVRDDQDNGTIIDFVQHRTGGSLGEVRKELRPWIGRSPALPATPRTWPELEPASKDLLRVQARLAGMPTAVAHEYLERERAIPQAILADARFAGRIRADERGNAVFPHWKDDVVCGFEVKNRGFTGFSGGGEKGLWLSHGFESDNALVVAESAIDALSHFAIRRPAAARYASIAGAMNPGQPALLRRAAGELPAGSRLLIATDNDEGGDRLTVAIQEALRGLPIETSEDRPPTRGLDWNDVLKSSNRPQVPPTVKAW